jgi:hypothetical protein
MKIESNQGLQTNFCVAAEMVGEAETAEEVTAE